MVKDAFGPGNCHRVDEATLECGDIRFPVDSAVAWQTTLISEEESLEFRIALWPKVIQLHIFFPACLVFMNITIHTASVTVFAYF